MSSRCIPRPSGCTFEYISKIGVFFFVKRSIIRGFQGKSPRKKSKSTTIVHIAYITLSLEPNIRWGGRFELAEDELSATINPPRYPLPEFFHGCKQHGRTRTWLLARALARAARVYSKFIIVFGPLFSSKGVFPKGFNTWNVLFCARVYTRACFLSYVRTFCVCVFQSVFVFVPFFLPPRLIV